GDDTYLTRARGHWDEFDYTGSEVVQFSWDDKRAAVFGLFYMLDGGDEYKNAFVSFLDWVKNDAPYTPEGLVFLDAWGANRHAANVAYLALYAAKLGLDAEENREWAKGQIGQLLGDNPKYQSFVVGYGVNPPEKPHHRSSSCPN
ncbi:hypothetical protein CGJ15_25880, partial [Vibrio parahaemolyticus]